MKNLELQGVHLIKSIYGLDAQPLAYEKDMYGHVIGIWYEIPNEEGEWETKRHDVEGGAF